MTLTELYLHPLTSLFEGWQVKAVASAVLVFLGNVLGPVFSARIDFVALIVILVIVDLLTGIAAAKRTGGRIENRKLRRTMVKAVEYTGFLVAIVAVSNVLGVSGTIPIIAPILANLTEIALGYVALTELNSIYENLTPGGGPQRAWKALIVWFRRRVAEDGGTTTTGIVVGELLDEATKVPEDRTGS